jgi:hypothetical protein
MDDAEFCSRNQISHVHNVQPALNRLAFLISQQEAESPSSRLLAGFKSLAIWKTSAMVAPSAGSDLPHHPLTPTEKLQELLKFMMDSYEMSEGETVIAVIPKKDRPVLTPKSSKLLKL